MSWPERAHTLPDGRQLRATYESEPVGWVVHLVGHEDLSLPETSTMRLSTCSNLATADGRLGSWRRPTTSRPETRPSGVATRAPCCGYLTLDEAPTGTYNICKVCFWEDDGVQFRNLGYEGGANTVSLNQARDNYRAHGVSETRFTSNVRAPLPDERP